MGLPYIIQFVMVVTFVTKIMGEFIVEHRGELAYTTFPVYMRRSLTVNGHSQ